MEIRQLVRILVFGYFSFLPNLLSYWIAAVLPQVIEQNLEVHDKEQVSRVGGLFFSFYFFGIIAGALAWPYILKFLPKKLAVLFGLFFQGVFTALTGKTIVLAWVYTFRFWTGFFNNVNTVGKDFIFEFAKPKYRQYAFSLKSCFTVGGIFVGPLLGYYIYTHYGCSLESSLMLLFWMYMIACLMFVVVFMIDMRLSVEEEEDAHQKNPHELDRQKRPPPSEPVNQETLHPCPTNEETIPVDKKPANQVDELQGSLLVVNDDEEARPLILEKESSQKTEKQRGIPEVLKIIWKNRTLRNFAIVYFLTNGVFTTRNFVLVFYLEASWSSGGLGISAMEVSYINFYSFFFCIAFLLVSPAFVPSKIGYLRIVRDIILISVFLIILPPLLRDLLPNSSDSWCRWTIYVMYLVSNFFNPKLFSPFINYFMNGQVNKYSRTALNSITFITSCISAAVIMTFVSPFLSLSLHNSWFVAHSPWNKYFCFVLLDLLLVCNLFYLRSQKEFIAGQVQLVK